MPLACIKCPNILGERMFYGFFKLTGKITNVFLCPENMISRHTIRHILTLGFVSSFFCFMAIADDNENSALQIISSPQDFPADKSSNEDRTKLGIGEKSTLSLTGKNGEAPKDENGNPKKVTWTIISGQEYGTLKNNEDDGDESQTATLTIKTDPKQMGTISVQAEVEDEEPAKKNFEIVLPNSLEGKGARMEEDPSLDPVEGFQGPSPPIHVKCDQCKQCPQCGNSLTTRCVLCIQKNCADCTAIKLEGNTDYYGANADIEVEMGPIDVNFSNVPFKENNEESPSSFPHKPNPNVGYPNSENKFTDSIGYYGKNDGSNQVPADITWVCGWYTTKNGNLNHPINKNVLQTFKFQRINGGIKITISKFGCSVSRNCTSGDNKHQYN